jgi:hypothetical protein
MDVSDALQTAVLIASKLNCPDYAELGPHFGLHDERVGDSTQLKNAVQVRCRMAPPRFSTWC